MNSGKLLDDFDVIFAIVVNQIYIRKKFFSLTGKTYQSAFSIWCVYGFVGALESPPPQPRPSWVWAYPLTENLPVRKCASFVSGAGEGELSGHR